MTFFAAIKINKLLWSHWSWNYWNNNMNIPRPVGEIFPWELGIKLRSVKARSMLASKKKNYIWERNILSKNWGLLFQGQDSAMPFNKTRIVSSLHGDLSTLWNLLWKMYFMPLLPKHFLRTIDWVLNKHAQFNHTSLTKVGDFNLLETTLLYYFLDKRMELLRNLSSSFSTYVA